MMQYWEPCKAREAHRSIAGTSLHMLRDVDPKACSPFNLGIDEVVGHPLHVLICSH